MSEHSVRLQQQQDYKFSIDYGQPGAVLGAELGPPLGAGTGPDPEQLLASAVGNCMSASMVFAARKLKVAVEPVTSVAAAELGKNAEGRTRVLAIRVELSLSPLTAGAEHFQHLLDTFENYCLVTLSVRQGIPVSYRVLDAGGAVVRQG